MLGTNCNTKHKFVNTKSVYYKKKTEGSKGTDIAVKEFSTSCK